MWKVERMSKSGIMFFVAAVAFLAVTLWAGGCQATDWVNVRVPTKVQGATDSPPKITLTEAEIVFESYMQAGEQFAANIEGGYEKLGILQSLIDTSLPMIGNAAFPGGAAVFGSLLGLAGLFTNKPGATKKLSQEKEDSYNAGIAKGKELMQAIKGATSGEV